MKIRDEVREIADRHVTSGKRLIPWNTFHLKGTACMFTFSSCHQTQGLDEGLGKGCCQPTIHTTIHAAPLAAAPTERHHTVMKMALSRAGMQRSQPQQFQPGWAQAISMECSQSHQHLHPKSIYLKLWWGIWIWFLCWFWHPLWTKIVVFCRMKHCVSHEHHCLVL